RAHAAADRERHEAGLGGAPHDVEDDAAVLVARRNVEEAQLVGPGGVVGDRRLDRIAGVAQVDEADALDHAAVLHVETGDDADLEHGAVLRDFARAGESLGVQITDIRKQPRVSRRGEFARARTARGRPERRRLRSAAAGRTGSLAPRRRPRAAGYSSAPWFRPLPPKP